jgi:porphyrinogen peroxidase
MLESMAGITTGTPDALTAFTRPITGAYYVVPSSDALRRWVPSADTDRLD